MLAVAHVLGLMMAFFGLLYLLPIAWSLAVDDGAVIDFVVGGLINAFVGLAVNNVLVFVDLTLLQATINLAIPRTIAGTAAMLVLVYGLIWEAGT